MKLSTLFIGLVLVISGCATSLHISQAKITSKDAETLTVTLISKENPRSYSKSYWADHVSLEYQAEQTLTSTTNEEYPAVARTFVFSVRPASISDKRGPDGYVSTWIIPRSGQFDWAFTRYKYVVRPGTEIRLRFRGGTMHGTTLQSNEVRVLVPN